MKELIDVIKEELEKFCKSQDIYPTEEEKNILIIVMIKGAMIGLDKATKTMKGK